MKLSVELVAVSVKPVVVCKFQTDPEVPLIVQFPEIVKARVSELLEEKVPTVTFWPLSLKVPLLSVIVCPLSLKAPDNVKVAP